MSEYEDIYEYLVPFLQYQDDEGGNYIYDPEAFMGVYGDYISPIDYDALNKAQAQGELLTDSLFSTAYRNLRSAEAGAGVTGISGKSVNDALNATLLDITSSLYSGNLSSLQAQSNALRGIQDQVYSDISNLALLDIFSFDPESTTGVNLLEFGGLSGSGGDAEWTGDAEVLDYMQYLTDDFIEDLPFLYEESMQGAMGLGSCGAGGLSDWTPCFNSVTMETDCLPPGIPCNPI